MDRNPSHRSRLRVARTLVVAALLGLTTIGLSQCRLADRSLTGVDLTPSGALDGGQQCVKTCKLDFKAAKVSESARHRDAVRACDRDRECIAEENHRHRQTTQQIVRAYQQCKRTCYNEGSGAGGR